MLACPGDPFPSFFLNFNDSGIYAAFPINGMVVLNAPDSAVQVSYDNAEVQNTFLNLPGLQRNSITGADGYRAQGSGSSFGKYAVSSGSSIAYNTAAEALSDFNFEQLWQDGVQASAFMYSDTAYDALPNATTLNEGQIVAPPTYWVSSTATKRYALQVVITPGTTGTPNYGLTTCTNAGQSTNNVLCTGPSATITATSCSANVLTVTTSTNTFASGEVLVLQGTAESFFDGPNNSGGLVTTTAATSTSFSFPYTCYSFTGNSSDTGTATVSSLVDLSPYQYVTLGSLNTKITAINSSNPASIVLALANNATSVSSPTALTYTAPGLGLEMQLPTKSSAAPSTQTWSQGDMEQNSVATANGVAAWVNVSGGTPGTWAGIPLGNSSGQISASQIAGTTGSGNVVLASGPTFTGNTATFANGAAAEQDVTIQPGSSADQVGAFAWNNYSGTAQWKLRKDASNYLRLTDVVNSLDREVLYQNGQTVINAGAGANPVVVNGASGSGTGGLLVENGGSSPAAVLTVSGSGNTTATGFVAGKFMIGSGSMTLAANAAAGTGPTIACATSHVCDGVSGTVTLTTGTGPSTGTLATFGFPNTHTNNANCVVMPTLSGSGLVSTITWSESTTNLTLTANTALSASTAYQIRYWCGGN
jgi:hypothetical protein